MKAKIIATIGPSSINILTLRKMKKNGMSIARLNTKHGSVKQHLKILSNLKKLKCDIMLDIKNINIPDYLKQMNFDYVALSFAESKNEINLLRKKLEKKTKIISKIETKKGIKNINSLIDVSDGIMIARGDLGRNLPFEKVPIFQKLIIKKCRSKKKFSITATEMLLSLMRIKIPERSEVSDIANAVLDGSDALMLSEESAIGKYPSLAVGTMAKIITSTEKNKRLIC